MEDCNKCKAQATLIKALEKQLSYYRSKEQEYDIAINTIKSERAMNVILTDEISRLLGEKQ